jgi:hypothetical protein
LWFCSDDRRGKGVAGCRGPKDKTMEPDGFAMPTPPRTSGFSCSRVELPLLTHPWLLTCSRVACCLARALAYGIESSRVGHWQNTSARTRERAGSIPLGPLGSVTPLPSPPAVTPSGLVYHHRRSYAARRTASRCFRLDCLVLLRSFSFRLAAPYLPSLPPQGS